LKWRTAQRSHEAHRRPIKPRTPLNPEENGRWENPLHYNQRVAPRWVAEFIAEVSVGRIKKTLYF
jgi:hypothetical protein